MIKVRIKKQAKARTGYQVQGSLANDVPAMGGADYNAYIGQPKLRESRYITADPRDQSNVEAEGGEIVYGDINGDNFPEAKIIKGPRHAQGGVPLNLPEDTFIYSDTRSMRIKDPEILQMFGKGGSKKSYTPAELAKPYDINKYRVILEDPNSDAVDRKTAELMIKKFVVKLGCLALKQESMKGFPQGIPAVARPCMEAKGLKDEDILPNPELKQLNDTIKAEIEKPQEGFSEESMESAEALNQGQPIAEPTQAATNNPMMEQGPPPSPEEMMRYGGFGRRKLRKGQMGMQQPSQEGMMMQQAGQQIDPEIIQEVQAALEGGAEPMAVIETLLQGGLDPQMIVDIFVQLGAPQEQAVGLVQQVMQGGGQEQMMAQQPMQGQPMSEQEMMAQQQMMEQQAPPMAAYGMSMGGYDMPFYDMPEAAYGMSMGANPNNYMGRRSLPRAQGGIQINVDGMDDAQRRRAIRDAQRANPGKEVFIVEGGQKKRVKSSTFKLPEWDESQDLGMFPNTDDGKIAAAQYYLIEKNLQNPDVRRELIAETRNALADKEAFQSRKQYNAGIASTKNYQTIFGDDPMDPAKLSDDKIIEMALKHQRRNYLAQGHNIDPQVFTNTGDKLDDVTTIQTYINPKTGTNYTAAEAAQLIDDYTTKGWTNVQKASKSIGLDLDESGKDRAVQQATMHGYARMHKKYGENGYTDPDVEYNMYNFLGNVNMQPSGAADEESMGGKYGPIGNRISPIDDVFTHSGGMSWYDFPSKKYTTYGDTTFGHQYIVGVEDYEYEDIIDPQCQCEDPNAANYGMTYNQETGQCEGECNTPTPKKCPCEYPDGRVVEMTPDPNTGECPPCEEDKTIETPGGYAPWWLQDTIKTTGAFGDLMGIKKYMPWSPGVDLEEPRPSYLDPTRELAANAEQANIQTQGMAQFAGPQALSARSSGIQGQAAKNAGDILAKYNNANVNIGNQFELKATDVRNQESMLRQAAGQRLYDQNTVANQQFDNAKLAMRNNLRNYYTNAITNRWKTDALNQMYPDYAVDPSVGGQMYHTPNYRRPTNATTNDATDYFKQREKCVQAGAADPDACARNAVQNAMRNSKGGGGNSNMINTMYGNQISVKEGGSVYDNLGYVYFNPLLM